MSVWESTTYKLDIAKAIYQNLPGHIDFILGREVGSYLRPRGDLCEIQSTDTWADVATLLDWEEIPLSTTSKPAIEKLIKGVNKWTVGIHGVYSLVYAVRHDNFQVREQHAYARIERHMRALASILAPSTQITPAQFTAKWGLWHKGTKRLARMYEDAAEAWKYYARSIDMKEEEFEEIDQDKYFGDGSRLYYGGAISGLVILRGSSHYTERGIILTRKHVDMLIGTLLRVGNIYDFAAHEYATDMDMIRRITGMLDMTIKSAFSCSRVNVDKVVQAFHKARSYTQMVMFENQMQDALDEACVEFQNKNLQTVIDLNKYVSWFVGLPKGRWLDLIHVYKWMPPPDYDPTYAFTELYEHHMSTRPSALDPKATPEMKRLWDVIVRERKLNIATTYMKINRQWPATLPLENNYPTEEGLDGWEPVGLFPYFTYGKDVTNQIKDKATVLARFDDEVHKEGRTSERNFLLWYLINRKTIDTDAFADQVLRGVLPEDNFVRVAYKGEAHKPGSRLFFMAPPIQRLLLGEMEGNISRIASSYPASLQGVDSLIKASRLAKLFSLDRETLELDEDEECTGYIITFDLSKFSPKFNPAVLQDLHNFWANVFSYEPIRAYGKFGAASTILHTTCKLVMHYKNKGADLEGFRGRMMTLFHADLIAAACRIAKEAGYIVGRAQSAVFIDDGAVRVAATGTGDIAQKNALNFLKCMQEVYAAAGQENHPNKTIVSSIGGELLAEQYIYGQRLKCPLKAGMRLFPPYECPAASLTDEFDALFATAQGSLKDGATWVSTYRRLAESYAKAIYRWCRREYRTVNDVEFALKLVTPKSMSGFGFPSLQALTTTTAYDMTAEGLGILSAAAKAYDVYAREVNKIIGREVVIRPALQVFRDPGRVRLVGPILVEGRLRSTLVKKLRANKGPWTDFVDLIKDEELVKHATAIAVELLNQESVSLPLMKRAWDCVPLAYVESLVLKFQRAVSIQAMLTAREISSIRRKNINDVRDVLMYRF